MESSILSALKAIDVSQLTRAEWITVGMALKEEGYPCSVWDDWSRNDSRYHPGECERKWRSFRGSGNPVKGGTIGTLYGGDLGRIGSIMGRITVELVTTAPKAEEVKHV